MGPFLERSVEDRFEGSLDADPDESQEVGLGGDELFDDSCIIL